MTAKSRQRRPLVFSGGQPLSNGCVANNWFNIFTGDEQTKTITTFSAKPEEILEIKKSLAEKSKYRYSSTCGGGEVVNHDTKNDNKFRYYDTPQQKRNKILNRSRRYPQLMVESCSSSRRQLPAPHRHTARLSSTTLQPLDMDQSRGCNAGCQVTLELGQQTPRNSSIRQSVAG